MATVYNMTMFPPRELHPNRSAERFALRLVKSLGASAYPFGMCAVATVSKRGGKKKDAASLSNAAHVS